MTVSPKIRTRRTLKLTLVLLSMLIVTAACDGSGSSNLQAGSTPVGASAPRTTFPLPPATRATTATAEFSRPPYGWTLLDNSRRKLANYSGQVVVLDFYATWCPPCREEAPHLVKLQKQYAGQGLRVVGLNVGGADDRDKVPEFVKEFGITYTLGFPDQEMVDLYLSDDDSIPQTYVFNRDGRLVKRFISYGAEMPAELERVVQTALAANGGSKQATAPSDTSTAGALTAVSH
ncbi:MAG: redoxin domain-containing protein [Pyrinomonadaceae bacterium]